MPTPAPKADPAPALNGGFGNVGSWNFGSGNQGDWNFGNGNLGSNNVGSGNLGGSNVGIGNNGSNNFGGGNTGNGNIGFGNTGNGNIGIGLTGDNQFGFGGLNSGTGNMGLFNSGTGNVGIFNSGTGNWGIGNSGNRNTGSFNSGNTNTGDANVGNLNTGSFNVGHSNSGNFNTGSNNTGDFNGGDLNTGSFNSGDANTGLFNSGYLNTGLGNSGNASNGFFETADNQNWFPGIHVAYTIPGISIDKTFPLPIDQQIALGPLTLTVGPTTTDVHVTGSTGPITLTVFDIPAGPGFFNTGTVASSGVLNSGAGGGSGLLNTGVGLVSGFFNLALLAGAGLSGFSNSGSGSGFSNLGSALSGWRNTTSLSLTDPAYLSGVENIGTLLAGMYINGSTGGSTFNLGAGNLGYYNFGDGNQGAMNLGAGNLGSGNVGFGNGGDGNIGSGNAGDKNFGGGNAGSENIGSGNLGSKNWGWGNNGSANFGGGNTGNGNIGFGNTGNGNIGIGLTGDNQFGIGGLNSGTGNMGLFNSGTGNTGIFNSGTNNWGFGNSGILNTGFSNSGNTNTGLENAGNLNSGSNNAGSSNTGNANVGNTNTGVANIGDTNSGWSNTGNTNTGWVNTGTLNTGAWNTGNGNNGLFWRRDAGGQLNIDLGADLSQVPITLSAEIPVNVPITAQVTDPISVPSLDFGPVELPVDFATKIDLAGIATADVTINALGTVGPITFPGTEVHVPQVVGTLGGPGVSVPITLTGAIGPGRISVLKFAGPGLFNMTETASSGLFNTGNGGGSGLLNAGTAVSGLMNQALLSAGLSGLSNSGSGSGFSNVGSAVSGQSNTSSLDPKVPAFISGLRNFGTNLSGLFVNAGDAPPKPEPPAFDFNRLGINLNANISEIPINLDGNIGVNIPLSASLTGPITVDGFTVPTIPGNILGTAGLNIPSLLGPIIIPLTPDIGIGPIIVPDLTINATDPLVSGAIGGPGVSIPIHIAGAIGPNNAPLFNAAGLFSLTKGSSIGADVNINVLNTPIKLNGDIPVDIPVNADFGDLTLDGCTIPGFNITSTNWTTLHNSPTNSLLGEVYTDFEVPGTTLPVTDIKVNPVTVELPTLSGLIGGPGSAVGLNLDGGLGTFGIGVPIDLVTDPSLGINLDKVNVSAIPLYANLGVSTDLPVTLDATPIHIAGVSIDPVQVGPGLILNAAIKMLKTPPAASDGFFGKNPCGLAVPCTAIQLQPVINAGPVGLGPIDVGFPGDQALALNIGGPGKGVVADAAGLLGPITISLADGKIEEFPYSYVINAGVDIPINGSTGSLVLRQTELSAPVKAVLLQRIGYCNLLGSACFGSGLTKATMINYVNGGSPAGSALGTFPPGIPTTENVLIEQTITQALGPLTLLAPIPLDSGFNSDINLDGSGTLGPFNLGSG